MLTIKPNQLKNKTLLSFVGIIFFGWILLMGCSNTDDTKPDSSVTDVLLDKWWYPYYSGTDAFYLHSDGKYDQKHPNSEVIDYTGNWVWVEENKPLLIIDYDEGTDQILSSYWLGFSDIKEHTVTVSPSDNGTDFFFSLPYEDTNN